MTRGLGRPRDDIAESIGLLTTVLGYGNDTVARNYLSLAMKRQVPSLDLSALFRRRDLVTTPVPALWHTRFGRATASRWFGAQSSPTGRRG